MSLSQWEGDDGAGEEDWGVGEIGNWGIGEIGNWGNGEMGTGLWARPGI